MRGDLGEKGNTMHPGDQNLEEGYEDGAGDDVEDSGNEGRDNDFPDSRHDRFPDFDSLGKRASGDTSPNTRSEWSTGEAASLTCSDRGNSPNSARDFLGSLMGSNKESGFRETIATSEFERKDQVLSSDRSPTERSSEWGVCDITDPLGGYACELQTWTDFFSGTGDFIKNYYQMKEADVIGADRFYHCMANCESAERGPGGLAAAVTISYGREAIDLPKNVLVKGLSWKDSVADAIGDLNANRVGREGALNGVRCYTACEKFRPRGL